MKNLIGEEYDFSVYTDKVILSTTRENIEKELLQRITQQLLDLATVNKVNVILSKNYVIEEVKIIMVINSTEEENKLTIVNQIISDISETYKIDSKYITIVCEEV